MGDHTECLEITYNSDEISYGELLDIFWESHSAGFHGYRGRQYQSLILFSTEEERSAAEIKKREWEKKKGRALSTEIAPFQDFTRAEDYHQKYYLRRFSRAAQLLKDYYGSEETFGDGKLSARLNAVAAGKLSMQEVKEEVAQWCRNGENPGLQSLLNQIRW